MKNQTGYISMKPGTLLSPTAVVMASCADGDHRPNIITLAWVGTVNSDPPMVSVSVRPERHSHGLIAASGEFVVNLVSRELMRACDLCGVKSGREMDKFAHLNLRPLPVAGSPAYLACKLRHSLELGSHTMFLGEIVGMGIREDLLNADGRIDLARADLVAYCHGEYMGLGPVEGFFGYSVARPEVLRRRMKRK